ncbi:MAG: YckD family protein [Clostridia bacterium]|nr:YckD family protein [Clostridia bacterium]
MKNVKKFVAVLSIVGVLGTAGAVYALEIKTPADVVAGLTGKSITEVNNERTSGKTYGTIAKEANKLDEFKAQMLEQKKAILDQRVKDGTLTQEQADAIYKRIKDNQALCDGTGNEGTGRGCGAGFGNGKGMGRGLGSGSCTGLGAGNGSIR